MTSMHFFLVFAILITFSISAQSAADNNLPGFRFSRLDDNNTFQAGSSATIKITLVGNLVFPLNLTFTVNDKTGNSCYVSGVYASTRGDPAFWNISFLPISIGTFNVLILDHPHRIFDSSLHFHVTAGRMYPSVCVASWRDLVNEFVAGEKATVLILPRDAFGNNISSTVEEPNSYNFLVSSYAENGSAVGVVNLTYLGWTGYGYVGIEFVATTTGNLHLQIQGENQTLNGSPLPFKVQPGPLDITKCLAKWSYETNALQIFSKLEIFIHQLDQFGNLVPGLYVFDARVVEQKTSLSIPIADLYFNEVEPGIQLFSFSVLERGEFLLTIFDLELNQTISSMPSSFTVFVGYCDGLNSVINGSGLVNSIAGKSSKFSVYLEDKYHNPSPIEAERVRSQITRTVDSHNIMPIISPMQSGGNSGASINASMLLMASSPAPVPAPSVRLI